MPRPILFLTVVIAVIATAFLLCVLYVPEAIEWIGFDKADRRQLALASFTAAGIAIALLARIPMQWIFSWLTHFARRGKPQAQIAMAIIFAFIGAMCVAYYFLKFD